MNINIEDCRIHLYDGDTETQSGECIGIKNIVITENLGYLEMENGEQWSFGDLDDFERELIIENIADIIRCTFAQEHGEPNKRKVLDVFQTATDAYLEFLNNFITKEKFIEHYNLDETDADCLFTAAVAVREKNGCYTETDYFFNIYTNEDYTEVGVHW